jgi:hypothetical protein
MLSYNTSSSSSSLASSLLIEDYCNAALSRHDYCDNDDESNSVIENSSTLNTTTDNNHNSNHRSTSYMNGLVQSLPSTTQLMKRIGNLLAVSSTAISLLIIFPLLLHLAISDARAGMKSSAAFYSAASYVTITLALSIRGILSHLHNWYAPDVQKFVVRILFMVPLYSVQSWLGLRFHGPAHIYIVTVRELYEAYVIQSFVYYLIELLGGEDRLIDILGRKDATLGIHHPQVITQYIFWLPIHKSWNMGIEFLHNIKHGVLQYVVIKTCLTLLTTFVLLPLGLYGEGSFTFTSAYVYVTAILEMSVLYAMYCLVKLFHAIKSDLRHPINWHPIGKFLCVKGVIFFTFWQDVGINFLKSHNIIGNVGNWSGDEVAGGVVDYLICVEMVFFSIAHLFTFTYKEYLPEGMIDTAAADDNNNSSRRIIDYCGAKVVEWMFEGEHKRRRRRDMMWHDNTTIERDGDEQRLVLQSALLSQHVDGGIHNHHHHNSSDNDFNNHDRTDYIDDEDIMPCIDEDGNIIEESYNRYRPSHMSSLSTLSASRFSKLEDPLSLREALWSSTVPRETLDDIKRLGLVSGGSSSGSQHGNGGLGYGSRPPMNISLTSLNNAESI